MFVALTLAGFSTGAAARYRGGPGLDLSVVVALFDAARGTVRRELVLATHVLPRWLGWAAALVGLFNLAAVATPATVLAQFPTLLLLLWILATSVVLLKRSTALPVPTALLVVAAH